MVMVTYWHEFRDFFADGSLIGILLLNLVGGVAGGALVAVWLERRWNRVRQAELSAATTGFVELVANLLLAHGLQTECLVQSFGDLGKLLQLIPEKPPHDTAHLSQIIAEGGNYFDRLDAAIQRLPGQARGSELQVAFHEARSAYSFWGSQFQTFTKRGTEPLAPGTHCDQGRAAFVDTMSTLAGLLPQPHKRPSWVGRYLRMDR